MKNEKREKDLVAEWSQKREPFSTATAHSKRPDFKSEIVFGPRAITKVKVQEF